MAKKKKDTGFLDDTWRKQVIPASILGGATGLKVFGGFQQASNLESAGKSNARDLRDSAAIKGMTADMEDEQFARSAHRLREGNRASAGGSGFQMSGSMLDAMADTASQLELQRQINKWASKVEGDQMLAQATNVERQAEAQADQARTNAFADLAKGLYTLTDLF